MGELFIDTSVVWKQDAVRPKRPNPEPSLSLLHLAFSLTLKSRLMVLLSHSSMAEHLWPLFLRTLTSYASLHWPLPTTKDASLEAGEMAQQLRGLGLVGHLGSLSGQFPFREMVA